MRILGGLALCVALGGCVTNNETVQFRASNPQQQTMMRGGQPALVSHQKSSLVLVRPASRHMVAVHLERLPSNPPMLQNVKKVLANPEPSTHHFFGLQVRSVRGGPKVRAMGSKAKNSF
jgi:hypothetical protein